MDTFKFSLAVAALLSCVPLAQPQVADKKSLTMDGARRVITASLAEANAKKTTGVIAVVDNGGNLMALDSRDGKPLWHTRIGNASNAPQTYLLDGHQQLLIAVGDTLYAFTLY